METTQKQKEYFYLGFVMSYFLDSNVLIDWILISENRKDNEELSGEKITIFRDNVFKYIARFKKFFNVVNDVVDKKYFPTFFSQIRYWYL